MLMLIAAAYLGWGALSVALLIAHMLHFFRQELRTWWHQLPI
jgi:hypothetical protein